MTAKFRAEHCIKNNNVRSMWKRAYEVLGYSKAHWNVIQSSKEWAECLTKVNVKLWGFNKVLCGVAASARNIWSKDLSKYLNDTSVPTFSYTYTLHLLNPYPFKHLKPDKSYPLRVELLRRGHFREYSSPHDIKFWSQKGRYLCISIF